jgi:hypothetical protein
MGSNTTPDGLSSKNSHSRMEIGFLETNEIKLRSEATSLFDVQRWAFDVHFLNQLRMA